LLYLGTSWKVSGQLHPPYPLDRRLDGSQSQSGRGEEKILDPTGTQNSDRLVIRPVISHYTNYAIPAHVMEIYLT
jgi:hypothetical protein